jgi:hypothetical protein
MHVRDRSCQDPELRIPYYRLLRESSDLRLRVGEAELQQVHSGVISDHLPCRSGHFKDFHPSRGMNPPALFARLTAPLQD